MDKKSTTLGIITESVLGFIFQNQNCRMYKIAEGLKVSKGTVNSSLKSLQDKGYVTKHGRHGSNTYRAIKSIPKAWRPLLSERSRQLLAFIAMHGPVTRSEINQSVPGDKLKIYYALASLMRKGDLDRNPDTGEYIALIAEQPFGVAIPALRGRIESIQPARSTNLLNAKKDQIEDLIKRGLMRRAQTVISQLIAETGDVDTVNWALNKSADCGCRAKYC